MTAGGFGAGRALALAGLAAAATGCAGMLDLDRARAVFGRAPETELPELTPTPAAGLPAPEGLRATSGQFRAVPLKWDPLLAGDVGGYVVERARERAGPFLALAPVPGRALTAFVDEGGASASLADSDAARADLEDGVTYFYRVRAFDETGHLSATVSEVAAATTAPLPDPPEGLRAYSHQPRQVPLSWSASEDPNVAGYAVERSPTSRGPFEQLDTLDGRHATVYLDDGLGDLRVFYYRVAATNPAGVRGPPSEPVRAVTKPDPLPPVGLRVEERGLGVNRLTWDPNVETDLARYRLLRIREGGSPPELVAELLPSETSARDPEVAADERLAYAVVAVDHDGLESAPSRPIVVESEGYGLTATVRQDGIHLAWSPREGEGFQGARVERLGFLGRTQLATVEGASYVDRDVVPGRSYRYVVVLKRKDGEAPPSSVVEIAVPEG